MILPLADLSPLHSTAHAGPARVVQPGAAFSPARLVTPSCHFISGGASRDWTMRSWDRTSIPKPFSTVAVVVGEPMFVSGTDDGVIESACRELGRALESLESPAGCWGSRDLVSQLAILLTLRSECGDGGANCDQDVSWLDVARPPHETLQPQLL